MIFEGDLSQDGKLDQVPENWRRRTQVLCRTLDQYFIWQCDAPAPTPAPRRSSSRAEAGKLAVWQISQGNALRFSARLPIFRAHAS